jgi:hypothetical protein
VGIEGIYEVEGGSVVGDEGLFDWRGFGLIGFFGSRLKYQTVLRLSDSFSQWDSPSGIPVNEFSTSALSAVD